MSGLRFRVLGFGFGLKGGGGGVEGWWLMPEGSYFEICDLTQGMKPQTLNPKP